jgi:hypothetical protein
MKYGDMREEEEQFMDGLLAVIHTDFGYVRFLEIGVLSGNTARGIVRQCNAIGCKVSGAGVDFAQWRPNPTPCTDYQFHAGDSMDAWRGIGSVFNLIFVDGCHCVNHSMCDFLNYSPMLEVGGYCLMHDTAAPLGRETQDQYYQNHAYAGQPDSVLGVRDGLKKMGLLQGLRADWQLVTELKSDSGLMGVVLLKKLRDL